MAKINILDSSIFNKIAAGEVVERPASVVKELVENSIDAGATSIHVYVENGGINKIKVVDNGCGIEKEYIKTAFLPHATSKISSVDDLFKIGTLGFRGEALASICSVSQVNIISKTCNSDIGVIYEVDGGISKRESEIGAPNGTNITVENLFYNVPARFKFLKKPKQEEQEITNLMSRIILANPNISIKYTADGKEIYNSRGTGLLDAIFVVYGKELTLNVIEVNNIFNDLKITGFISKPSYTKPNKSYQTLILNGRVIENNMISLAVSNAYGETLMKRQYPFFVLNITIPNENVDVNVHPSKKEVHFENPNKIFGAVYTAIVNALTNYKDVKNIDSIYDENANTDFFGFKQYSQQGESEIKTDKPEVIIKHVENAKIIQKTVNNNEKTANFSKFNQIFQKNYSYGTVASDVFKSSSIDEKSEEYKNEENKETIEINLKNEYKNQQEFFPEIIDDTQDNECNQNKNNEIVINLKSDKEPKFKEKNQYNQDNYIQDRLFKEDENFSIIGVVFNTYIIVEKGSNLYFIDQHAGHEKLLYDSFIENIKNHTVEVQQLMFPEFMSVNAIEKNYIDDNLENLNELGFDITLYGDDCYKISSVPLVLSDINLKSFWTNLISDLKDYSKKNVTDFIKEKLASCACKHAVKGGDKLSQTEIELLLQNLSNDKVALHCPHGRPIIIKISKVEFEKWFKRIV